MRRTTPIHFALLAGFLAAPAGADSVPMAFSGEAFLPYGCPPHDGSHKWSGQAEADGLVDDQTGTLSAFDVFAKGGQAGQCPPPSYGFAGSLDRGLYQVTLSMERCFLTPNLSTDLEPAHDGLDEYPDYAGGTYQDDGRFAVLNLRGTVHLWRNDTGSAGFEFGCDRPWTFRGMTRSRKAIFPPPGEEDELPELPQGPKVKSRARSKAGSKAGAEAAPALFASLQPCPPQTLCMGKAGSGRADLLIRNVPQFDGSQALAYVTLTTSEVEVWRRLPGQSDAEVVSWLFPALKGTKTANSGLLDTWDVGFAEERGDESRRLVLAATADSADRAAIADSPAAAQPKPPSTRWLTFPAAPGFRFQVRFNPWLGGLIPKKNAVGSTTCPADSACFGRTAAEPAILFVRLLTGKNGARSPILAKFASEPVEIWIEQTARKKIRYYRLDGTLPDHLALAGVYDPEGFPE